MENGNARQCFVKLQACSEKRGAMKNLFIDIFQLMINCGKRHGERAYKAATELSVRYVSPEAPPPVLTCTLKQTRNFSNKFRNNYLLVTYCLFRDPFNGEKEHKVPLFFAEKNTEMLSGTLNIKLF